DGFLHGAAEIAAANTVFDGNVAGVRLAIQGGSAVGHFELTKLRERYALSRRREQANVFDGLASIAIAGKVAGDEVVALFALEHLGDGVAAHGGLNGVLDVCNVHLEAGGRLTVHGEVEIGLAGDAEHAEVVDAADGA